MKDPASDGLRLRAGHALDGLVWPLPGLHGFVDVRPGDDVRHADLREQLAAAG
jgi:hypothetical protein